MIWTLAIEETSCSMCTAHAWAYSSIRNGCRTSCGWTLVASTRHYSFAFIFKILEFAHDFAELSLPLFLLDGTVADSECSFSVNKVTCSWSSSEFTVDALPMLLEVALNVLKPIQCRHLAWFLLSCCWTRRLLWSRCLPHCLFWTLWMTAPLACCLTLFVIVSSVTLSTICKMRWILAVIFSTAFHLLRVWFNLARIRPIANSWCWCWLFTFFSALIHIFDSKL